MHRFCKFTMEWMDRFPHISARFKTEGSKEMPRREPLSNRSRLFFVCAGDGFARDAFSASRSNLQKTTRNGVQ